MVALKTGEARLLDSIFLKEYGLECALLMLIHLRDFAIQVVVLIAFVFYSLSIHMIYVYIFSLLVILEIDNTQQ